jgi:hypothetical protein
MKIKDNAFEGIVTVLLLASMVMNIIMFSRTESKIESVRSQVYNLRDDFSEQFDEPNMPSPQEIWQKVQDKRLNETTP